MSPVMVESVHSSVICCHVNIEPTGTTENRRCKSSPTGFRTYDLYKCLKCGMVLIPPEMATPKIENRRGLQQSSDTKEL